MEFTSEAIPISSACHKKGTVHTTCLCCTASAQGRADRELSTNYSRGLLRRVETTTFYINLPAVFRPIFRLDLFSPLLVLSAAIGSVSSTPTTSSNGTWSALLAAD